MKTITSQIRVLIRNKLTRLPENIKKRSRSKFKRYEKRVSGHRLPKSEKRQSLQA